MTQPAQAQASTQRQSGQDPLGYWLAQEQAEGIDDLAAPAAAEEGPALSGWWILPVLVMALPVWGVILWLLLR